MTIDQWLSASLDAISFLGFLVVIIQLRDSSRQTKLNSQIHLYDINRELISMGFSNPKLFAVLTDAGGVDPELERRYSQLWFNQLALVHAFKQNAVFEKEVEQSFDVALRDMMSLECMRRYWRKHGGEYYPASFQKSIDDILHEAGVKPQGTASTTSRASSGQSPRTSPAASSRTTRR